MLGKEDTNLTYLFLLSLFMSITEIYHIKEYTMLWEHIHPFCEYFHKTRGKGRDRLISQSKLYKIIS